MVCMKCLLRRFAENAKARAEEWASVPAIANTHRRRQHELEFEIANMDRCPHDNPDEEPDQAS